MQRVRRLFSATLLAATLSVVSAPAIANSEEMRTRLQADLQKHIYRSMADGVYHALDSKSGDVLKLHPLTNHPVIMTMGDYYVMCADFRDHRGKKVDVDFYMLENRGRFQVFRAEANNHKMLAKLVKKGKATLLK
jgi:hypothetical protein